MPIRKIELVFIALGFVGVWIVLSITAGGPLGTDTIYYIHASINNVANSFIYNRYFHVFLQKLFIELSPDPLTGVRIFWSFLVALTSTLVYLSARVFQKQSTIFHGLLAAGLFFSLPFLASSSGDPVVDITVMAMVTCVLSLIIAGVRRGGFLAWHLLLLGLLFFLAFKTKETALLAALALPAIWFSEAGKLQLALVKKNTLLFAGGIGAGILVIIVLNTIILDNPLFGLRLADAQVSLSTYSGISSFHYNPQSWYQSFLFGEIPLIFGLFLIAGARSQEPRFFSALRPVWILPLVLVVILTFSMVRSEWGVLSRYFYPFLPVVCILAAQSLDIVPPKKISVWAKLLAVIGVSMFLVYTVLEKLLVFANSVNWEYANFIQTIYWPILFSILLGVLFLVKTFTPRTLWLPVILLAALLYYPITTTFRQVVVQRIWQKESYARFEPFSAFREKIAYSPEMQMYLSPDVLYVLDINPNRDEMLCIFNTYFEENAARDNFMPGLPVEQMLATLPEESLDYILLSAQEWRLAAEPLPDFPQWEISQSEPGSETGSFVLLSRQ